AQRLQRLLQRARLEVAAEQDAEVTPRRLSRVGDELDLGRDLFSLVRGIATLPDADALTVGLLGPQALGVLVRVVGDQGIRGAQYAVGAAVVLLQLDHPQRRVV